MIDNFAPQPYPLECSADGETWALVLGWERDKLGAVLGVVAALPGLTPVREDAMPLRYRLAAPASSALRIASTPDTSATVSSTVPYVPVRAPAARRRPDPA